MLANVAISGGASNAKQARDQKRNKYKQNKKVDKKRTFGQRDSSLQQNAIVENLNSEFEVSNAFAKGQANK